MVEIEARKSNVFVIFFIAISNHLVRTGDNISVTTKFFTKVRFGDYTGDYQWYHFSLGLA